MNPRSTDIPPLPFLKGLSAGGFRYGSIVLVEFQPNSLWYEAALTIASQALNGGVPTDFHVFQHPADDARRALRTQGIDVDTAERQHRLRIIDSYSVQTGLSSPEHHHPYGFASRSLKMSDWLAESPQVLVEPGERRILHIDENNSVLLNYNDEADVLRFFRTRAYEGARRNEILFVHSFVTDTHSPRFYSTFESLADIILDFESREEMGKVGHRVRVRKVRGRASDSRWRPIEVLENGEVGILPEHPLGGFFRGQPASPTPDRRLVAIMFTDMVGFTALAQEDEVTAVELLEEHQMLLRQAFGAHGGVEIKTMGDSFLVEFASALAATECALAIHAALKLRNDEHSDRPIHVRIGIHAGDVIHREGDVYGDAVNIASRIEPLAPPDGICVSQQVYDQVWNKINRPFAELGKKELKNLRLPLGVYRIDV